MNGQTYNITVTAIDVIGTSGNRSLQLEYHWNGKCFIVIKLSYYTVPMRVTNFTAVQNVETSFVMIAWNVSICTCAYIVCELYVVMLHLITVITKET